MPFQVSPGVNVSEIDLTTVVPAVSTTEGAIGGVFRWGPVGERILVSSEQELANRFGRPTSFNAETFFTAANFLSYGNKLYVSRGANTTSTTDTVLSIASANSKFPSGTVYQRNDGSTNSAVGTIVTANSTALVINVATMQGAFSVYTGSNTALMITDGTNTATITAATEDPTVSRNAALSTGLVSSINSFITKNENDFATKNDNGSYATADADTIVIAKYPGLIGNSLKVSICDSTSAYESTAYLSNGVFSNGTSYDVNTSTTDVTVVVGANTATLRFGGTAGSTTANTNTAATDARSKFTVGDVLVVGNSTIGTQLINITAINTLAANASHAYFTLGLSDPFALATNYTANNIVRRWEYHPSVDRTVSTSATAAATGNSAAVDELHVVVVDEDGQFSGTPGTILEVFSNLSRSTDSKSPDGATVYYKDVINQNSQYVWVVGHRSGSDVNTALYIASSTNTKPFTGSMTLGTDGKGEADVSINVLTNAYDLFASAEEVDVSLILQGKAVGSANNAQLANYIIDNICESRKDCVAFISPAKDDVVANAGDESTDMVGFRNASRSSSYAVLDSGYKYQYDKYNDVYRYVPLNGDTAGLCVRTDDTRDPWFSPAGFNRGQIKNIIKLAYNPDKANRDILYKANINPVVTFPGQGTVLYGDKTMLTKPSAFDRINVRRLFIVLEKAIATAAKYTLFEFNDEFTRAQFKNLVEPFLRDVQGRRGIYDFKVVCDSTNNTGEVIDRNEFVGDIYIKPAKSINFIQLNFVAVRTGVEFSEIVGQF